MPLPSPCSHAPLQPSFACPCPTFASYLLVQRYIHIDKNSYIQIMDMMYGRALILISCLLSSVVLSILLVAKLNFQLAFTCSKLAIKTPEQCVKSI